MKTGQSSIVSLRLSDDELAQLKTSAGKLPISSYIRRRLFSDLTNCQLPNEAEIRLTPQMRQKLLAQILTHLGQLDMVHNVNLLINALQSGLIETSPELCAALETVHVELKALRHDLLKALGLRP